MTRPENEFEPPLGPILGSILGVVAWLLFILIFALQWSKDYSLFQDLVVTIVSLAVTGLGIGAMWLVWYRLTGEPRRPWEAKSRPNRNKEILDIGQRAGEIVAVGISVLILAFFAFHQFANTGFFTSSFGPWAMFAFYGIMFLAMAPPIARAVVGRRNPVRPIEAAVNIFFAAATLYLLGVFPFNFAHFADALPSALRFMFWWLTNEIAKIAMVLAVLGSLVSAVVNVLRYLTFSPILSDSPEHEQVLVK